MTSKTMNTSSPYAMSAPFRCRVQECLIAVAVAIALIIPRGAPIWLGLAASSVLGYRLWCTGLRPVLAAVYSALQRPSLPPAVLAFWGLISFATISIAWSNDVVQSLNAAPSLAALSVIAAICGAGLANLNDEELWHVQRGVVHGFVFGLAYLTIEQVSSLTFKLTLLDQLGLTRLDSSAAVLKDGRVFKYKATILNRHSAALSILVWPALYATRCWLANSSHRLTVMCALMVWSGAMIFASESETAKLSFVVACVAFGVMHLARARMAQALALIFCTGSLLTPLLVLKAVPADAWYVAELQDSARSRILIWNHTVERAGDRPLLGTGANMTPVISRKDTAENGPHHIMQRRLDTHAHNFFVQTWFELGVIGAILLALTGALSALAIPALNYAAQPFGAALFASMTGVMVAGYGMWQSWLLSVGLLALTLLRSTAVSDRVEPAAMYFRYLAPGVAVLASIGFVSLKLMTADGAVLKQQGALPFEVAFDGISKWRADNYAEALPLLLKAHADPHLLEKDRRRIAPLIALAHLRGLGTNKDLDKASDYACKDLAAAASDYACALIFADPTFKRHDKSRAITLMRAAAKQGYRPAERHVIQHNW